MLLEAPPGAGKSTIVPLFAARPRPGSRSKDLDAGAAPHRGARRREPHGARCSASPSAAASDFARALETRVSRETRIEVVTEGILTRMLQDDSGLAGIGCVIFDEFHERSLNADLGLALCIESQQNLREDLRLLVMSATLDLSPLARLLRNAPIVSAQGRSFDVTTHYVARRRKMRTWKLQVSQVVRSALREHDGDILCFLAGRRGDPPGAADLEDV